MWPSAPCALTCCWLCLQKQYLIFQEGTRLPGLVGSPSAFPEGCSEICSLPSLGMEQPTMVSWPGCHRRGSTEQEVVPFPTKRSKWRQEGPIFPCAPPLSPHTRLGMLRGSRWGFRACSHVLPAPPSWACRGRSRHAPAVLGRRKQIGFPAGVQGAGRPWLVSHHCSVGMGCGERPGRAGVEGADLAEGSLWAVEFLREARHHIGLTRSQGCRLCLCLPLVLR